MQSYLYEDMYRTEDEHWWHIAKRTTVSQLIEKYLKKNPAVLLDVGCGTGKNLEMLAAFGKASGVDVSKEALAFCKKRGLKNVSEGSAENTGEKAESIDVVTMLDVLEHVREEDALRETKRILKKGGLLVITVPAFQWLWSRWDEVLHHKRRYSAGALEKALVKQGFRTKKMSYMYSFLFPVFVLVRSMKSLFAKKSYGSDFSYTSGALNMFGTFLSNIERKLLFAMPIPFGTSVVCVAEKS